MSDDDFTIDTSRKASVPQLDLSALKGKIGKRPADPAMTHKDGDANRPSPGKPTEGPHRISIEVPHDDETALNLGAASPVIDDDGITGRTKTHVHFYVKEGEGA